jgi:hypothetical protein
MVIAFDSPSKFLFSISVALFVAAFSIIYVFMSQLLTPEHEAYEDSFVYEAKMSIAQEAGDNAAYTLSEARYKASQFKIKEISSISGFATTLAIWALWFSAFSLCASILAFLAEMYFRLNKSIQPNAEASAD